MQRRRDLENDLGFLLARSSALVVRATNIALTPLGLRVRPYTVLSLAANAPGGVTQRAVAADMGLDPSQVVALIDDLEERGLVARRTDPSDRRNKLIVATEAGVRLAEQAGRLSEQASAEIFAAFDPVLLDELRAVLRQVIFPGVDEPAS